MQIFDQKKFKKKDQGFLGVVNVVIRNVIDLDAGGDGIVFPCIFPFGVTTFTNQMASQKCSRGTLKSPTITWLSMAN